MESAQQRLREILAEAIARTDPAERAAYLGEACGEELALRSKIEALIRAYEQRGDALEQTLRLSDPVIEGPGTVIGRYKLLEQIGEGGFGVVFMAEQREPIRRRVALKIIKPGMDTKRVIARFEAERQALALMDHPNIAQVFDAGSTEAGRPYFVMELVQGVPITDFCDNHALSAPERLKLFMTVCDAVQHAHQKGIIHRDLKPSNILVTLHDGKPVPKVIDFGTAKALQQFLTEKTLFTGFGKLIGTPQYMSPEQAEMSGLDVDTRADIYSLGVLLYELLTGTTPFEAARLRSAAFEEMMRIIRQEEPPKPSTRVSTLGERGTEIAKQRQVDPAVLRRALRGDLDWIVMKALEKERGRRYETASALAEDLQRHLNHQPVVASPQSAAYRARKFIRRNRPAVAIAGAVTLALVAGLSLALAGLQRAVKAEGATRRERDRAVAAEGRAQSEAAIAEAVNQFLQRDLLWQASPLDEPDREVKLRTLLDRAAGKVGARFKDKPLVEAQIRITLSEIYSTLGEYTNARVQLDRALEIYRQERVPAESPRFLKARAAEADLLLRLDHRRDSQALLEQLLPAFQRLAGSEHEAMKVMWNLAVIYADQGNLVKAQQLTEEGARLSGRVLGAEHHDTLGITLTLAGIRADQGEEAQARELQERVLATSRRVLGEDHAVTLRAKRLSALMNMEHNPAESQRLLEELQPIARRVYGPDHPFTLQGMITLAALYRGQSRLAEAQKLEEEALLVQRQLVDLEHGDTVRIMLNLAATYQAQRKFTEAQKLYERVLAAQRRTLGPEDPAALATLGRVANSYLEEGKLAEAGQLYEDLVEVWSRLRGAEHPDTLQAKLRLAEVNVAQGSRTTAEELVREVAAVGRNALAREDPDTLTARHDLAVRYFELGHFGESQEVLEGLVPAMGRVFGPSHRRTLLATANLAAAYSRQKKGTEAQKLGEEVLPVLRKELGAEHPDTLRTMNNLAVDYASRNRWGEAQLLFEEALAGRRRILGPEHPDTLWSMLSLSSTLSAQRKWAEAGKLYEEAIAGLQRTLGPENPTTIDTRNNLAWMLATCADSKARDGRRAVELAEEVVRTTCRTNDTYLDTLAAAYAETGRFAEAIVAQQEAIATLTHPWQDSFTARLKGYETNYAAAVNQLRLQGKLAELETLQRKLLDLRRAALVKEDPSIAESLAGLTRTLLEEGKYDQAESSARDCLKIREKVPVDGWETFDAWSLLGAALAGQKKYAEAERPLLSGYDGLKQRESMIPPIEGASCLKEALQRLVQFYDATDRPDHGAQWKQRLAELEKLESFRSDVRLLAQRARELSQKGRWQEAGQLYEEVLPLQREAFGPADYATIETLKELGALRGSTGDWQRALELFQELIALKPDDHWPYYYAHAVALAAGRGDLCRDLSTLMLKRFADSLDVRIRNRAAKSYLLSPNGQASLEAVSALARRDHEAMPNSPWFRTTRALAEYRQARYAETEALLEEQRRDPNPDIGCMAAYLSAMAGHQQGKTAAARLLLEGANQRFADVLGTVKPSNWWDDRYRNVAVRAEAERLILGREVSPPVTFETLTQGWKRWEPVRALLNQANGFAQEAKWKQSREAYVQAMENPGFVWGSAEHQSVVQCLAVQIGVVLVRAGDGPTYERHCRFVLGRDRAALPPRMAEIHAQTCLVNPKALPADVVQQAVVLIREAVSRQKMEASSKSWWTCQIGGIAEYRAGDYPRAMELLEHAEKFGEEGNGKITCRGGAMVYRAMALKQLGREEEARQVLAKAEALLVESLRTRSDTHWWDLDICQLALDEARQIIGQAKP